jgi:Na+-transporting NADH:ubiquinone oxidoreductase subunit C
MKKDGMAYTVLFTFVVCIAFVFFLALANELTKDKVAANRRLAERSAVLSALGFEAVPDQVDALYEKNVRTVDFPTGSSPTGSSPAGSLYAATVDGQVRFAKRFSGAGLWGTISGVLAVDSKVERIVGLRIVSHNETPGLGGRIDESWFKDQFAGERIGSQGIRVRQGSGKGDGDPDNSEVDSVTGASRTSESMQSIVNKEIADFRTVQTAGGLK